MKRPRRLVAAAALAAFALTACGGTAPASDSPLSGQRLVFVNYGGVSADAAQKGWLDPFSEKTGIQFAIDGPSELAKVKAMVESGSTTWDVIDLDPALGAANCGTLFEKRPADFDMSQVDPQYVTDECGVPIIVQAVALVYNTELFGANPPTKASDFYDTATYPGKRMFLNSPTGSAEPLLAATGVTPEQMYPIDFPRLRTALQGLGSDVVAAQTLAQITGALESGDFAMCLCYTGRMALAAQNGAPVDLVWDQTWLGWDNAYAIKGSQSPQAQMAFLQYLATPESVGFYEVLPYGPATPAAKPNVSDAFKSTMPDYNRDKINTTYNADFTWWADNADAAYAEWTRTVTG
jgi:putative spermidine/putrescine transport system substrate-binding protein